MTCAPGVSSLQPPPPQRVSLTTLWALLRPYWFSEDRWAGAGPAGPGRRPQPRRRLPRRCSSRSGIGSSLMRSRGRTIPHSSPCWFGSAGWRLSTSWQRSSRSTSTRCCRFAGGAGSPNSTAVTGSPIGPTTCCSSASPASRTRSSASRTTSASSPTSAWICLTGLINAVATLGSFLVMLWTLSGALRLHVAGYRPGDPGLHGVGGHPVRGPGDPSPPTSSADR